MRVTHGYLLLVLLALPLSSSAQVISGSPDCLSLVIPSVRQYLEWKKKFDEACEQAAQALSRDVIEQRFEGIPENSEVSSHESPVPIEEIHAPDEQSTGPDHHPIEHAHTSIEIPDTPSTSIVHGKDAPQPSPHHSPEEYIEHQHEHVTSQTDTDAIGHDAHPPSKIDDPTTSPKSDTHEPATEPETRNPVKSWWNELGLPSTSPAQWTLQDYAKAMGSISSAILVSMGAVSAGKKLFQKNMPQEDDSPTKREHKDDPPEPPSRSASSSDQKLTPEHSDESPSPSPAPDQTSSPKDQSDQEGDSSFVLIDKEHTIGERTTEERTIEDSPNAPSTGRHDTTAGSRDGSRNGPAKPLDQPSDIPRRPALFETKDEGHVENRKDGADGSRADFHTSLTSKSPVFKHGVNALDAKVSPSVENVTDQSFDTSRNDADTLPDPVNESSHSAYILRKLRVVHGLDDTDSSFQPSFTTRSNQKRLSDTSEDLRSKNISRVTFGDDNNGLTQRFIDSASKGQEEGRTATQAIRNTIANRQTLEARASSAEDESEARLSDRQTDNKDFADGFDTALGSLDTILTSRITPSSSDNLTSQESSWTPRYTASRSRPERSSTSPTWSPSGRRSPASTSSRNRWSSPTGRQEAVRAPHNPDNCAICIRNAQRAARAANGGSTSLPSTKTTVTSMSSESRQQVNPQSSSTSLTSRPEEGKKRYSFGRTLSQVLSPSWSKSTPSLSSGSSSKIYKTESRFRSRDG